MPFWARAMVDIVQACFSNIENQLILGGSQEGVIDPLEQRAGWYVCTCAVDTVTLPSNLVEGHPSTTRNNCLNGHAEDVSTDWTKVLTDSRRACVMLIFRVFELQALPSASKKRVSRQKKLRSLGGSSDPLGLTVGIKNGLRACFFFKNPQNRATFPDSDSFIRATERGTEGKGCNEYATITQRAQIHIHLVYISVRDVRFGSKSCDCENVNGQNTR